MKTAAVTKEHDHSPWSFTFADRLGKALSVSGVSNQEMAEALGVSRTTITNYTSGRTVPSKLQLKEWSLKTGAPLEWLTTGIDQTENPHPHGTGEGLSEPPAGLDPATCGLQGRTFAPVTDINTWRKAS